MDPVQIDKNLRAIKAIESSWTRPQLPDMVSLDLAAMSGLNEKDLTSFLWGVSADMRRVETQPTPTLDLSSGADLMSNVTPVGQDQSQGRVGPSEWNVFWSDIAGMPAASTLDRDAITNWKRQAMERGQIPLNVDADGNYIVDNRWGPEFQSVWNEQTADDFESRFRGNKYGAMSLESIADHMAEWLSPTGLFKAAVQLDLLPDFQEIGRETTWNPKTWINAVDDLVIPAVNIGLMLSGVGEVMLVAKGLHLGYKGTKVGQAAVKGVQAYNKFNGALTSTRVGKLANRVGGFGTHYGKYGWTDDAARMAAQASQKPGYIGTKLANSNKSSFQQMGQMSQWWRETNVAGLGKAMTQQGMRLGLAGRTQGLLGYDDQGALGLDFIPGVDSASNFMYDSIVPSIMFESMFTPVNLLAAGSLKALGPANALRSWSNVGREANLSEDLYEGIQSAIDLRILKGVADGEDVEALIEAQRVFKRNAKKHGKAKASMFYLFDEWGDITQPVPHLVEEQMGQFVTYLGTMAALDHAALNISPEIGKVIAKNSNYYAARNNLINQLRYIDPEDIEQVMVARAWEESTSHIQFTKKYKEMQKHFADLSDEDRMVEIKRLQDLIESHNKNREVVFKNLMNNHMDAGVLKEYMARHLETLGPNWRSFQEGMDTVQVAHAAGDLDNARFMVPTADDGARLMDDVIPTDADHVMAMNLQEVISDPEYAEWALTSKQFNPLMKAPNKHGRFTVARKETITKQQKLGHVAAVRQVLHLKNTIRNFLTKDVRFSHPELSLLAPEKKALESLFLEVGGDLAQIDLKAVNNALKRAMGDGRRRIASTDGVITVAKRRQRLERLIRYAKTRGIQVENAEDLFVQMDKHLDTMINDLDQSIDWTSKWNLSGLDDTMPQYGTPEKNLAKKADKLEADANFTAAEVDPSTMPEKLVNDLEAQGYKLVHGVEFATPADLNDFMIEFKDLKEATEFQLSLGLSGSSFQRHIDSTLSKANYFRASAARKVSQPFNRFSRIQERGLYQAALRNSFQRNFAHLNKGAGITPDQYNRIESVLMQIVNDVSREYRKLMSDKAFGAGALQRGAANLRVSFTPHTVTDLVRTKHLQKILVDALSTGEYRVKTIALGGSEARTIRGDALSFLGEAGSDARTMAANQILSALKEARVVGPKLRGPITNWMDQIQSTPQLTNTMRLLGQVRYGPDGKRIFDGANMFDPKVLAPWLARQAGTVAGGAGAVMFSPAFDDFDLTDINAKQLGIATVGALTGRAVSTRLLVGSQNAFKGKKLDAILGIGSEKNKYFKAGLQKVEQVGNWEDIRKGKVRGILNRHAMRIDLGHGKGHYKAWSYLGDHLSMWRDFARFTLSPVFDASRYSEAIVLGQIASPENVNLRFNISPSKWRSSRAKELAREAGVKPTRRSGANVMEPFRRQAKEEFDMIRARYKNAAANYQDYDYDALEAATARFSQVGILGFNTYEWETSVFADLVRKHGMDDIEAYKAAKHMFTYGVNPRSPAEVNINAIFFPFSFTKKTIGHAAKFAAQDWSRTAMIHNALRTYYMLDDKYNLDDMYEKYLPIFDKVSRLNLLANGVALGQFGGANRPLLDTMLNVPVLSEGTVQPVMNSPIMNAFLPQVFDVSTPNSLDEAFTNFQRTIPLINDMNDLVEDVLEQAYVVEGSPNHITRRAEIVEGSKKVQALKYAWEDMLQNVYGVSFAQINQVEGAKEAFDSEMELIYDQYPAYYKSIPQGVAGAVQRSQEEKDYMEEYRNSGISNAEMIEKGTREQKIGMMLTFSDECLDVYKRDPINEAANVPADVYDGMREVFISWVEDDPTLLPAYRRYFQRTWGPIETRRLSN